MFIFYEETETRRCEVNIDLSELTEYESVEEYIELNRKYFTNANYYSVYESKTTKPKLLGAGSPNNFDKAYLEETEEQKEFINDLENMSYELIWHYRSIYRSR